MPDIRRAMGYGLSPPSVYHAGNRRRRRATPGAGVVQVVVAAAVDDSRRPVVMVMPYVVVASRRRRPHRVMPRGGAVPAEVLPRGRATVPADMMPRSGSAASAVSAARGGERRAAHRDTCDGSYHQCFECFVHKNTSSFVLCGYAALMPLIPWKECLMTFSDNFFDCCIFRPPLTHPTR